MGATSTEGTGHGSAEGPVRGLGDVTKILKQTANEVKFAVDANNKIRSRGVNAEEVSVTPVGNLTATDAQEALEDHQDQIDALGGVGTIAQLLDVAKSGAAYDSVEDAITAVNALGYLIVIL